MLDDEGLLASGAVVLVNVFTPMAGETDRFIAVQTAEYRRLKGLVEGALGNRLLRSLDGERVVNIAYFASRAAYDEWRASDLFDDHLGRIRDLVERVEPDLYSVVYTSD